jgi:hypothetical protein
VEFEWDAGKAASNLPKHGVSFAEAMTVFRDALEVMIPDPARSGGKPLRGSGDSMSQKVNPEEDEDMLPEYDFAQGVRGRHHEDYKAGTNVIFLEPDLAKVFTNSDSVNRVLRLLLNLAKENVATNSAGGPEVAP